MTTVEMAAPAVNLRELRFCSGRTIVHLRCRTIWIVFLVLFIKQLNDLSLAKYVTFYREILWVHAAMPPILPSFRHISEP
jgi:hypothetical protein